MVKRPALAHVGLAVFDCKALGFGHSPIVVRPTAVAGERDFTAAAFDLLHGKLWPLLNHVDETEQDRYKVSAGRTCATSLSMPVLASEQTLP